LNVEFAINTAAMTVATVSCVLEHVSARSPEYMAVNNLRRRAW
jgi:hypothetical protein